eukprot:gene10226-11320_t
MDANTLSIRDRPEDRSTLYYERAKQLSLLSSMPNSMELERQLREVYKALSYQSEDIRLFLLLGKIYKQNLDLSSALFCYRFVLKKDPSNEIAQKVLIQLLTIKGKEMMLQASSSSSAHVTSSSTSLALSSSQSLSKYMAARSFFDEALEYSREDDKLLILKTVCHVQCGELNEAFVTINKTLAAHKTNPSVECYILRAKINWGRGLIEQGNQDIRSAAAINSNHPEVINYIERSYTKSERLYTLAIRLFRQEEYPAALEAVNFALFLTQEDVKLYILQSKIYRMKCDYQLAYEAILRAQAIFDIQPQEIRLQTHLILNDLAMQYASKGQYDEAILIYNRIIREINKSVDDHLHLTNTTSNNTTSNTTSANTTSNTTSANTTSNTTSASVRYHKEREQEGDDVYRYWLNRGDCYRALGLSYLPDAILDYLEAYQRSSSTSTSTSTLPQTLPLQHQLQPAAAAADWNINIRLSIAYYHLAIDHFNHSNFLLSESEASKAIQYNPKITEYWVVRGRARYYLGNYQDAYLDYKEAIRLDPNHQESLHRLKQFEADSEMYHLQVQNGWIKSVLRITQENQSNC